MEPAGTRYHIHFANEKSPRLKSFMTEDEARAWALETRPEARPGMDFTVVKTGPEATGTGTIIR